MQKSNKRLFLVILILVLSLAATSVTVFGRLSTADLFATAPELGAADSFGILGATTVTNTGDSVVYADLGVYDGTSITGFSSIDDGPGTVTGNIHAGDTVAQNAQGDVTTAYNTLAEQECGRNLSGIDLGTLTLTPGVYCFDTSAQLTGTLTLDAQDDEWSVFIFKIGSTLTTASGSSVNIINADNLCNLFWQVGSSATLGTTTAFKGNILALESITLNNGAAINGRALARTGAVTMDTNIIRLPVCEVAAEPTPTSEAATQTATAQAATQTAIAATQTIIAPTLTAQAATLTAQATVSQLTSTAASDIPAGGDLAEPGSQITRISLGALTFVLFLFGFMAIRRTQKTEG